MEYAKKNNISIQDACTLFKTSAKIQFYNDLKNRLDNNRIPIGLYTKEEHLVGISSESGIGINVEPIKDSVNISSL